MRTPYYPADPDQAFKLKWYMKGENDKRPRSVFRNRKSGRYEAGEPVDYSDNKLAPTGVSVIFATYEPHNKRQNMSILLHPVMEADGRNVKFLSTFRQEIGPCVLVHDSRSSAIKGGGSQMDMLYPPAAIYGLVYHCSDLGSPTTCLQQRPDAELSSGRSKSSYVVYAFCR